MIGIHTRLRINIMRVHYLAFRRLVDYLTRAGANGVYINSPRPTGTGLNETLVYINYSNV